MFISNRQFYNLVKRGELYSITYTLKLIHFTSIYDIFNTILYKSVRFDPFYLRTCS